MVLLFEWPETEFVWLDAAKHSAEFLGWAVERLRVTDRVHVAHGRAEDLGRSSALRGGLEVVVSRSFGRPATTAECAAPFLVAGGHLVVSEPPAQRGDRWDEAGLARLGLELAGRSSEVANYQVLRQGERCPDTFPRRNGRPGKRPLF